MKTPPLEHSPLANDLMFTDIHCHLLPGIDDGPKNWQASLAMARAAIANGIRTIVATPHQLGRYEKNTAEQILHLTAEAQQRVHETGLPLTILPGADVRVQERLPELVEARQVLTLGDQNAYLLMELPHDQVLPMGRLIYELQCQGVTGILSHPERNQHLQKNPEALRPWVQQGCLIQITAGSITGHFGRMARQMSRWLCRENLVHLVATDAHDVTRRPPQWRQAFQLMRSWQGKPPAQRIFFENPQAVAAGRPVLTPLPSSSSRSSFASWVDSALAVMRG
jgi:protein-tyrosine phosphatase